MNKNKDDVEDESKWILCEKRLPEKSIPVIAYYKNSHGNGRRIRAMYVKKFTYCTDDDSSDFLGDADYDEKTDQSYWPEGWYENNEHEDCHWQVDDKVTHWMMLPEPPKESK